MDEEFWGKPISVYTRANALEDGELVDVSEVAKEAGFKWPCAVTRSVWSMVEPSEEVRARFGCDTAGRLWDLLYMAIKAIRSAKENGSQLLYQVVMPQHPRERTRAATYTFKLVIGPGDTPEPVITIMKEGED